MAIGGVACIAIGIALIYVPASFVVTGTLVLCGALRMKP
jgi:hypothetical protein